MLKLEKNPLKGPMITKILSTVSLPLLLTVSFLFAQESSSSPEEWAEDFIQFHGIYTVPNAAHKTLEVTLAIDQFDHYSILQSKIAKLICQESQRPSINLQLNGKRSDDSAKNSCAIVGGMGPLSDARILSLIVEKLKEKNIADDCKINLLSAPPPRTFLEILCNSQSYLSNLYHFLNKNHSAVYLASNTAHLHFGFINALGKKNLVNLTHYIADKAKDSVDIPSVLILGTKAAKKATLYENLFQERSINYLTINQEEQEIVQEEINKTKMGKLEDGGEKLYDLICNVIQRQKNSVNLLLLACTELSIALESQKNKLEALGITILDSEELFAEKIANDIQNLTPNN